MRACVCERALVLLGSCPSYPFVKEIMLGLCFLLGLTTFLERHGLSRWFKDYSLNCLARVLV